MGKRCDFSEKRKCLMKTLKKLSEKLEDSPPCQVKPYPCVPCCPVRTCLPCGPPKCKCKLVQNCSQKSFNSRSKCGPFPDSCTSFLTTGRPISLTPQISPASPCCHFNNTPMCSKQSKCCYFRQCCCRPQISTCRCCCNMPCNPRRCLCSNRCCVPCCKPNRCCASCDCKKHPCKFEYCPRKKHTKVAEGTLCCGCNTICLPRSSSDTALVYRKSGKSLTCSKSVELRGSKLHRGCICDKRNGLQDRCQRYCCINNPKCRTVPASCHCSKYSRGKHLSKRYGKNKSKRYTCYICGPPMCSCTPCLPPNCCCKCYCQKKCDTECQCCPTTCEVQCCCQSCPEQHSSPLKPCLPCPGPCLPCPEPCSPCPEQCYHTVPCPEPSVPCIKTCEPASPSCCNCDHSCFCDEGTQEVVDYCTCHHEYCPPQAMSCQNHQH